MRLGFRAYTGGKPPHGSFRTAVLRAGKTQIIRKASAVPTKKRETKKSLFFDVY